MEKISNREFGKCVYSTKWKKMEEFSLFLYVFDFISTKWKNFIVAIHFQEEQNRLSNFIYFFIHISFHVHKVDYISPVRFISTKWKIFHQRTVFP